MASRTFKNQKTPFSVTSLSDFDIIKKALSVNDVALVGINSTVMNELTGDAIYAGGFCIKLSSTIVDYCLKSGLDRVLIMRMVGTEMTSLKAVTLT